MLQRVVKMKLVDFIPKISAKEKRNEVSGEHQLHLRSSKKIVLDHNRFP